MTLQAVVCCVCEEGEGINVLWTSKTSYEEGGQEFRFCGFCIRWFNLLKKANPTLSASIIIAKMKAEFKKLPPAGRYLE